MNVAGSGPFSLASHVTTPAAAPAAPAYITSTPAATDVTIRWTEPDCHGDPISHYIIEIGNRQEITQGPVLEHNVMELSPETNYK